MLAQLNYKTIFDELSPIGGGGGQVKKTSRGWQFQTITISTIFHNLNGIKKKSRTFRG